MNTMNDLQECDFTSFKGGDKETCLLRGKRLQTAREINATTELRKENHE